MASTGSKANDSPRPAWAKAIRDLRLRLKLSQSALGRRIGFSAMAVSRWERGAQEPPSHGYIGLGNLSRDASCWLFWDRAGLRSEDVLRVLPVHQEGARSSSFQDFEIATAGSGPKRPKNKHQLVTVPLLEVDVAAHGEKGDNVA